jgi:dipeptidyl aminopeptidase/acylaminoacyl peptidase
MARRVRSSSRATRAPRRAAKSTPARVRGKPVRPEDLLEFRIPRAGALSPDGSRYVFSVQVPRDDRKGYDSHLHLADLAGGTVRQFSYGKRGDGAPIFSADGAMIAFVSKRGHHPGIHLIPADGGEARTLVEKDGAFSDLSFSPDGRQLLCVFRPNDPPDPDRPPAADRKAEKPGTGAEEQKPPAAKEAPVYRHIDRLFYRLDGAGFLPREEGQLWLFDIETGAGRQLTRGKRGAAQPAFSPDGRRIAFVRNIRPNRDLEMDWTDLFVIPARGGRPRRIPTPPGPAYSPQFSPDGKTIAYFGHDEFEAHWFANLRPWVVPASGRGKARCLAPRFDYPAYDQTITDTGGTIGFSLKPVWSSDGRALHFVSSRDGYTALFRVPLRGGTPRQLTPEKIHLQAISLSGDARTAAGIASTPTRPPEVFAFDLRTGEQRPLTELNREFRRTRRLSAPQRVVIRSTENTRVEAWILKPPGFSPRRKYPAIVEIHGGPQAQYGYSFFHEFHCLAARGYVVFYSNPRGSRGYGRAFAEAIRGDWGNRDFADVMAGTDYLVRRPYVDEKRIGITGGSYGGFMTNWAVGHTRRYKAAVTQRSVVDLVPFFGSSDVGFAFRNTFGTYPWEDLEVYRRQSPLTFARNIRTPLLIIHSENDLRCNIEQAENLFATLKVLRRRVELVRFPGEPHGLSRGGRPDRRVVRLRKILDWFERYL